MELYKKRPRTINFWNFLTCVVDWATSMLHLTVDFVFVYILYTFTCFNITCVGYFHFWNSWKAWPVFQQGKVHRECIECISSLPKHIWLKFSAQCLEEFSSGIHFACKTCLVSHYIKEKKVFVDQVLNFCSGTVACLCRAS